MKDALRTGLQYSHLGLTLVVIVGLFIGVGYYADGYFNTDGVFIVAGIIVGSVVGFGYFILEIYRLAQESTGNHNG